MSLVIAAWDESIGIAVCEGRAIVKVNGTKVPMREDCSKLSRLPDGSILGLTGGLREGFSSTTMCDALVTEPLRREIHAQAKGRTFREMCSVIPVLLTEYGVKYPELGFGVSLLGDDNGKIRGAAFSSNGQSSGPSKTGVDANILGLNQAASDEATAAVRRYFAGTTRAYLDGVKACAAFERIIKDLASRHVELNDHVQFEFIGAPGERAISADGFCLNTLEPAEAGSDKTLGHVLTSKTSVNTAISEWSTATATPSAQAVPGFSWSTACSGTEDVFNISGVLAIRNPIGSAVSYKINVFVDGNTSTDYAIGGITVGSGSMSDNTPFIASITGLPAGAHTIAVYLTCAPPADNFQPATTGAAICQRIF